MVAAFSWSPAATLPVLASSAARAGTKADPGCVFFPGLLPPQERDTLVLWCPLSGDRYSLSLFFSPGPGWQYSPTSHHPYPTHIPVVISVTFDLGLEACCGILGLEPKPFLGKFLGFLSDSRTVVP